MKISFSGHNPLVIRLAGPLNEDSDMSLVIIPPTPAIEVDLSELTKINSVGIRNFVAWVAKLSAPQVTFTFCPRFFIDQVNMIANFIPERAKINSFYVPYYSKDTDEEKNVLYTRGQQYEVKDDGTFTVTHPLVKDANGQEMDLDALDRYFSFLAKF